MLPRPDSRALQAGASPYDIVMDAPLTLNVPGSGAWSPQNYSRSFRGEVTLVDALADSINTAAVRVSEGTGRARVKALAALQSGDPAQLSVMFSIDIHALRNLDAIVAFDDIVCPLCKEAIRAVPEFKR